MAYLLISGCSSNNNSYYGNISTANSYYATDSIIHIFANIGRHNAYSVPRRDRDQHEQCVYFALDNLYLGEKCDWYSSNGSTMGQVEVVAHREQQGSYCTTLYNSVFHRDSWKNWQDTACKTRGQWRFVSR